eukprot:gene22448-29067_t
MKALSRKYNYNISLSTVVLFVLFQLASTEYCWVSNDNDASKWFIDRSCGNSTTDTSEIEEEGFALLHRSQKFLSNKNIVMIGDSLTRYQYLNLIHSLHTNSWDFGDYPNLEHEKEWEDWKYFYLGGRNRFGCREICDCYRFSTSSRNSRENRHYFDLRRNISIHNFLFAPGSGIYGSNIPTSADFSAMCMNYTIAQEFSKVYDEAATSHDWYYFDHTEFIREKIAPLNADVLIINFGHLGLLFSKKTVDDFERSFFETARSSATHLIWKSTTARCDQAGAVDPAWFLKSLESDGITIFDAYAITEHVGRKNFEDETARNTICWDNLHFNSFVYREINKEFLLLLENILTKR